MSRFSLMLLLIFLISCQNSNIFNNNTNKNSLEIKPTIGSKIIKEK